MNDGPARASAAASGDYRRVRGLTTSLCETLATEDFVVQSMPDASPAKWHLAHTTWFFETFVLRDLPGHLPFHPSYEVVAAAAPVAGNPLETGRLHPSSSSVAAAPAGAAGVAQLFGDVWEWTASPYVGYPGYRPDEGALGEYNGKFMCNQLVLRGGSCVTPADHVRASYRNFLPPRTRWQFSGIRLAR